MKRNKWLLGSSQQLTPNEQMPFEPVRTPRATAELTRAERRERRAARIQRNLLRLLQKAAPAICLAVVILTLAQPLLAAPSPLEKILNNISDFLVGPGGRSIAIIGVVAAGIIILFGGNLYILLQVVLGIALILTAVGIISWLLP